eukprot:m.192395 g.192395  ORF g.192395 m.192395 type:complete len:57 (+) comp14854_c0_seq3:5920-6090(+)
MEIALDNMDNAFTDDFGGWPFRYYVLKDGALTYISWPTKDLSYSVPALQAAIESVL